MAFFCPIRIGNKKKQHDNFDSDLLSGERQIHNYPPMGRITGSASIETLVRVGIEKENGLRPDSKMIVLYDFKPCVDDELEVRRGQVINVLYQENDWVYVIATGKQQQGEGFIPSSYCAPYDSQLESILNNNKKKILPNHQVEEEVQLDNIIQTTNKHKTLATYKNTAFNNIQHQLSISDCLSNENGVTLDNDSSGAETSSRHKSNHLLTVLKASQPSDSYPAFPKILTTEDYRCFDTTTALEPQQANSQDLHHQQYPIPMMMAQNSGNESNNLMKFGKFEPFSKQPCGRYVVLYTFLARDENDVSVQRCEIVTVLNKDDTDWFWIIRPDSVEGFVPSNYIKPAELFLSKFPIQ